MKKFSIIFMTVVVLLSFYVLLGSVKAYVDDENDLEEDRMIQETRQTRVGNQGDEDEVDDLKKNKEDEESQEDEMVDENNMDETGKDEDNENREKSKKFRDRGNLGELMREKELTKSERLALIEEFKKKTKEERCEAIKEGMDEKISRYEHNYQYHEERYNEIVSQTEDLLDKLDSELNIDTTSAKVKLDEVKSYMRKIASQKKEFVRDLEQAREFGCENSGEGSQFRETLKDSKSQLAFIRYSVKELNGYIKEDLKEELLNLKQEVMQEGPEEELNNVDGNLGEKTSN